MTVYTEEQKLQINKAKTSINKMFPGCFLEKHEAGYTICDKEGNDILEEYMLPYGKDAVEAWKFALLTVKTTQHFNRSHPERLSLELEEEKMVRVKRKKRKSQTS